MASEKLRCSRGRFGGVGGGNAVTSSAGGGDGERTEQQMGHCARIVDRPAHDEQVLQVFESIIPLSMDSWSHDSGNGAAGSPGGEHGGACGVICGGRPGGRPGGCEGAEGGWT
eukprot:5018344-Prymnesium_polylepis.5